MKPVQIIGMLLIASFLLIAPITADKASIEDFTGTWTDANYSFTIVQDGTEISLTGVPFDIEMNFPMKLSGFVSENGARLITNKNITGTLEIQMSDGNMEMSGIQTFDPVVPSDAPFTDSFNVTRNGTEVNPDTIWADEWVNDFISMTIYQAGNAISGFFNESSKPEPKVDFEGWVSEDERNISLNWTFEDNVNFTVSDDGMHLFDEACLIEEEPENYYCLNISRQEMN